MMDKVFGAAYYTAPEVFVKKYDEKVDVWSVGVIMYTMLAGFPPFRGETELEIVQNVKTGLYDLGIPELSNISIQGKNLIANMLKYNPNERCSANKALNHDWFKLFQFEEIVSID